MGKSHCNNIKKLYLDFDGCIVNSIEAIVSMYNKDFKYYKKFVPVRWTDIHSWDFTECKCAKTEYVNTYFNQPRFFECVKFMDWAKEVIEELKNEYDITIVSHGYPPNLIAKEIWIKENLPFCDFVGVNLKKNKDKSCIDMSDGIFIDDSASNLITSNAKINVCFGDMYPWNENWNGFRCFNWIDVRHFLEGDN